MDLRRFFPSQSHNIRTIRASPLSELSGSLGDLGTLLPLLVALTVTGSISLSSTLVFTGIANILTGLFFSIPLPVQPMKAIAAVAIANNFSQKENASAGLFVAGVIAVFSATGLLSWLGRVIPIPVVKGIQVGAGLSLVISAGSKLLLPLGWTKPHAGDNYIWALAAFILLLATASTTIPTKNLPRIPYALLVFVAGMVISLIYYYTAAGSHAPFFGVWRPYTIVPSPSDFKVGAVSAGLGQIPLTTLNSIIAVTHLSADLLPNVPTPSFTAIGASVAVMNLVSCWFASMPVCHGSGGLAAQYRFGARSGASVIFLGLAKLILGLVVHDAWLKDTLQQFPKSILGIMVMAAGVELARVGESLNQGAKDLWEQDGSEGEPSNGELLKKSRDLDEKERRDRWMVMMVTIAGLLAFKNDAVGFIAGLLWHFGLKAGVRWERRQQRSERHDNDESVGLLSGRD